MNLVPFKKHIEKQVPVHFDITNIAKTLEVVRDQTTQE